MPNTMNYYDAKWENGIAIKTPSGGAQDLSSYTYRCDVYAQPGDSSPVFQYFQIPAAGFHGSITNNGDEGTIILEAEVSDRSTLFNQGQTYFWVLYEISDTTNPKGHANGDLYVAKRGEDTQKGFRVLTMSGGHVAFGAVVAIQGEPGEAGEQGPPGVVTAELEALVDRAEDAAEDAEAARLSTQSLNSQAASSASAADASADRAELAALAAEAGSVIYASEAAGNAAVANGVSFWVEPETLGAGLRLYRRVSAGVSTFLGYFFSLGDLEAELALKADLSRLDLYGTPFFYHPVWLWAIRDRTDHYVIVGLNREGILEADVKGSFDGPWEGISINGLLSTSQDCYIMRDQSGNVLATIKGDGEGHWGMRDTDEWSVRTVGEDGQIYLVSEEYDQFQLTHDEDAVFWADKISNSLIVWKEKAGARTRKVWKFGGSTTWLDTVTQIIVIIGIGQSNHLGTWLDVVHVTPPRPGRLTMPNGSVKIGGTGGSGEEVFKELQPDRIRNVVDAYEFSWAAIGEGPMVAEGEWMTEPGHLAATTAVHIADISIGGLGYDSMEKGTIAWENGLKVIERAYWLAALSGRSVVRVFYDWQGGEHTINHATPQNREFMEDLQADATEDVSAIMGTTVVPLILMQLSNFTSGGGTNKAIVQDQLEAMLLNPGKIYCVGPTYFGPYNPTDKIHMQTSLQILCGYIRGRAMQTILQSGPWNGVDTNPHALYMKTATREDDSANIDIVFNVPVEPIVIDTAGDYVTNPGNWGITYEDTGGNSPVISSISILNPRTIRVSLDIVPTGTNPKIGVGYYGITGAISGWDSGPRSSIHDSSPDIGPHATLNDGHMYNWACHQLIAVTVT